VVSLPGDASASGAVVGAVVEVVLPDAGGGAFAGRQGHVDGPSAEGGAGADRDGDGGAVDAGTHVTGPR